MGGLFANGLACTFSLFLRMNLMKSFFSFIPSFLSYLQKMSSTDENHFHPNDCLDDFDYSHQFFGPNENQDLDFSSRFFQDLEPSKLSIPDGSGGIPRFQRSDGMNRDQYDASFAVPTEPLFAVPLGASIAVPPEPLFAVPVGASFADPRGSVDGAAVGAVDRVTKGMVDGAAVGVVDGVTKGMVDGAAVGTVDALGVSSNKTKSSTVPAEILAPSAMAGGAADFSAAIGVLPLEILAPSAMAGGAADFSADDRKRQKKRKKKLEETPSGDPIIFSPSNKPIDGQPRDEPGGSLQRYVIVCI